MMYFLDTSVLTSYYYPEIRSVRVQRLLDNVRQPVISPLVEIELFCVVARKTRSGDIDTISARKIFAEFRQQMEEPRFHIVPIQSGEYALASRWIEELACPLRTVDALHLAAAFVHGLTLMTSDRVLSKAAKQFGIATQFVT